MEIELSASYEQNGKTVNVKATDHVESIDDPKILTMKGIIDEFSPKDQPVQIKTQYRPLTQTQNQQSGLSANKSQHESTSKAKELITPKQIILLRTTLNEINLSEQVFCNQHQIKNIEDIPKFDAREIIRELLNVKKTQAKK